MERHLLGSVPGQGEEPFGRVAHASEGGTPVKKRLPGSATLERAQKAWTSRRLSSLKPATFSLDLLPALPEKSAALETWNKRADEMLAVVGKHGFALGQKIGAARRQLHTRGSNPLEAVARLITHFVDRKGDPVKLSWEPASVPYDETWPIRYNANRIWSAIREEVYGWVTDNTIDAKDTDLMTAFTAAAVASIDAFQVRGHKDFSHLNRVFLWLDHAERMGVIRKRDGGTYQTPADWVEENGVVGMLLDGMVIQGEIVCDARDPDTLSAVTYSKP